MSGFLGRCVATPLNIGVLVVALALSASAIRAQTAEEASALQTQLRATAEEWTVLLPKLRQVVALRAEVQATAAEPEARAGYLMRALDSPLGGTSMDVPVMQGSGLRNLASALGLASGPFDPAKAPGNVPSGDKSRPNGVGRAFAERMRVTRGNGVQALLTDLQTLIDDKATTEEQLREKLAEVRAARAKATRDLVAAQADLAALLTPDQLASLVSQGYLD
jgi:hypothetical protein